MINDEIDNVHSVSKSSIAEHCVENFLNNDSNLNEQSHDGIEKVSREPDRIRANVATAIDPHQDTTRLASEAVSNVAPRHVQFTSTEELYAQFPLFSESLLNIWQPSAQPGSLKLKSANKTVEVPDNESVINSEHDDLSQCTHNENLELQRRVSVDYLNTRLLDNNLKLLRKKCEENAINKTFDCSDKLLEIRKLYGESRRSEGQVTSSAEDNRSISFRETFTNLIQGCNYFENKRLIPSAFQKTDSNPGALIDDLDSDISYDGNDVDKSGDVQTVNTRAVNQNTLVNTHGDSIYVGHGEQLANKSKTSEENVISNTNNSDEDADNLDIKETNIVGNTDIDASYSNKVCSFDDAVNKDTFDEALNVSIERANVFNSTEQSTILNISEGGDEPGSTASEGLDEGSDGGGLSAEELRESLQLSRSNEELHESLGDTPECLFHLTNDGSQGCENIRLRVMLPALNKVLCSNRVSQMTRTYHDIEAVTRLLEEKEKDLELTARIGKELLATNQKLENSVAALDSELKTANESITQLHYELSQKNELLTILTNDAQQDEDEEDAANISGVGPGSMQYEVLQRKIGFLERENRSLRDETDSLCAATDEIEATEQRLVEDLAAQLSYAQSEVAMIEEDLNRTRAELSDLKTQNQALVDKLSTAEDKVAQVTQNNTEMSLVVQLARETQCELAQELAEMKEKYAEVLSILSETQELLKRNKKKSLAGTSIGGFSGGGLHHLGPGPPSHNPDSLAAELECSLFSEFSLDSGIGGTLPRYKRVFDTVRCSSLHSGVATPHTTPSLYYESLGSSITTPSQTSHPLNYPGECPKGIPGIPGSADLEAALRRLTPGAVLARRTALSAGLSEYSASQYDCPRTPDSVLSNESFSYSSASVRTQQSQWRVPDKLQIVKPIEGSATLQHWSALATPSLSNILTDPEAGVKVRGSAYAPNPRTYTLDDLEEDDDGSFLGKQCETARHTYTLTNSLVKHPDSFTQVTPSMPQSRMSTAVNSRCSSLAPSRRNSISLGPSSSPMAPSSNPLGPAVSLSLSKVLHEQGIQAASPSALATPNYTPTATPCNSPYRSRESSPTREREDGDHSPSRSPPPSSSSMYSPFGLPGYLVASGAELLRRALVGPMTRDVCRRARPPLPPPAASTGTGRALVGSNKTLTNMSIVEQLEKIGLDNIVNSAPEDNEPATAGSGVPARPRAGSRPRVRADLGTVPFKGPSLGSLGAMRKGGLL